MDKNADERTITKLIRLAAEKTPAHRRMGACVGAAAKALERAAASCFAAAFEIRKKAVASRTATKGAESAAQELGGVWRVGAPNGSAQLLVSMDACSVVFAANAILGSGCNEDETKKDQAQTVTQIDLRLAQIFVADFVGSLFEELDQSTDSIVLAKQAIGRIEDREAKSELEAKPFAFASFDLITGDKLSVASIGVHIDVASFVEKSNAVFPEVTKEWSLRLRDAVMRTPITLSAILTRKDFCVASLWRLKSGDVLELERASLEEIVLDRVRGIGPPILSGALVSSGQNRALAHLKGNIS